MVLAERKSESYIQEYQVYYSYSSLTISSYYESIVKILGYSEMNKYLLPEKLSSGIGLFSKMGRVY